MEQQSRAFKLLVEYDGARYAGWQRQQHSVSVQQTLEEALEKVLLHPVRLTAAGRTDTGVHALGQVARLESTAPYASPAVFLRGVNQFLPEDIRIVHAEESPLAFDPRRDAVLRSYRYTLFCRNAPPVLDRGRMLHVYQKMDWDRVEKTLGYLRGEHDFRAFRCSSCTATRTVLTMRKAAHVNEHPVHHFDFECRSFLHNMIRILTGLLVEIGRGRLEPECVVKMFESGARHVDFRVAPPHGLVLMRVDYAE